MIRVEFSCWMLANSYKMKAQYKGNEKKGRMDKRRRSRHFRGHEHASFLEKVLNILFLPSAVLPSFSRPVLAPFYNFCFSKVIFHCHGVWRPQGNLRLSCAGTCCCGPGMVLPSSVPHGDSPSYMLLLQEAQKAKVMG